MPAHRRLSLRAICLATFPCLFLALPGAEAQTGPAPKRAATAQAEQILRPGQPLRVRVASDRERLSFRVAPEAGGDYVVVTRGLTRGVDTVLELLDASGRTIAEDDDSGDEDLASSLEVTGAPRGARIRVRTIREPGEFEVLLTRATPRGAPDFPTSLGAARSAAPLAIGAARRVRLRRGEVAFFALPEDPRQLAAVTRNLARGSDTVLALLDASGQTVSEDDDGGDEAMASYLAIPGQPRPLFLRASGLGDARAEFDLVLEAEAPAPPPSFAVTLVEASQRPPLAVGQSQRIELRRNQAAYFALPAGEGDLVALTRNLAPNTDTILQLVDGNGREVDGDDDGGDENLASRLELPSSRTGLFLRAASLSQRPASFDLVLEREDRSGRPDFGRTIEEARSRPPLALGQPIRVHLRADQSAVFALPEGTALEALTRNLSRGADSVLEVLDAHGAVLAEDDDGGDERLASHLDIPRGQGPMFLRARALGRGSFEVLVQAAAAAQPAAFPVSIAEAATRPGLEVGRPVRIELRRRQSAYFRLPTGRGLVALTRQLGEDSDTVLALVDAQGNVLAEDDDGGDEPLASRLALTGAGKGPVFLRASSLGERPARFELLIERR